MARKASTLIGKRKRRSSDFVDPDYSPGQEEREEEHDDRLMTPPTNPSNTKPSKWARKRVNDASEYPGVCTITHKVSYTSSAHPCAHVIDLRYTNIKNFVRNLEWFFGLECKSFNINQSQNMLLLCLELHDWYDNKGILILPTSQAISKALNFLRLHRAERVENNVHKLFPRGLSDFRLMGLLPEECTIHIKDIIDVSPGVYKETGTEQTHHSPFQTLEMFKSHINPMFAAFKAAATLHSLSLAKVRTLKSKYGPQVAQDIDDLKVIYNILMNQGNTAKIPADFLRGTQVASSPPSPRPKKRSKTSKSSRTVAGPNPPSVLTESVEDDPQTPFRELRYPSAVGPADSESEYQSDSARSVAEGLRSGRHYKGTRIALQRMPLFAEQGAGPAGSQDENESDDPGPEPAPSYMQDTNLSLPRSIFTSLAPGPSGSLLFEAGQGTVLGMASPRPERRAVPSENLSRKSGESVKKSGQSRSGKKGPSTSSVAPRLPPHAQERVDRKGKAPMPSCLPFPSSLSATTAPSMVGESNFGSHDKLPVSDPHNVDRARKGKGRFESKAAAFPDVGGRRPAWK